MKTAVMQRIASIAAPAGTKAVRHGVSFDGRLLTLCVSEDIAPTLFESHGVAKTVFMSNGGGFAKTQIPGYEAILLENNRHQNTYRRLRGMTATFPMVQLFPDGMVLAVAPRCLRSEEHGAELNAKVFDPSGNCVKAFTLGDGIQDVQVSKAGEIWVSYFDEGVFGNFGWTSPIGASGLVRFDDTGKVMWEFTAGEIADCYALNVFADRAWAYYYTSFELAEVKPGGITRYETGVDGAHAFALDSQNVAFLGGYGKSRQTRQLSCAGRARSWKRK